MPKWMHWFWLGAIVEVSALMPVAWRSWWSNRTGVTYIESGTEARPKLSEQAGGVSFAAGVAACFATLLAILLFVEWGIITVALRTLDPSAASFLSGIVGAACCSVVLCAFFVEWAHMLSERATLKMTPAEASG